MFPTTASCLSWLARFLRLPRPPTKSSSQDHYFLPRASPESWFGDKAPSRQQLQDLGKLREEEFLASPATFRHLGTLLMAGGICLPLPPAALNLSAEQRVWVSSFVKSITRGASRSSSAPFDESSTNWRMARNQVVPPEAAALPLRA